VTAPNAKPTTTRCAPTVMRYHHENYTKCSAALANLLQLLTQPQRRKTTKRFYKYTRVCALSVSDPLNTETMFVNPVVRAARTCFITIALHPGSRSRIPAPAVRNHSLCWIRLTANSIDRNIRWTRLGTSGLERDYGS
jgi:hypothetical protein